MKRSKLYYLLIELNLIKNLDIIDMQRYYLQNSISYSKFKKIPLSSYFETIGKY